MLDVLHALGRRFGNVDGTAANHRTASGKHRKFRNGHLNRHKLCSLCPVERNAIGFCPADMPL